ncbi:unnamed protein product [Ambrosiozyma monospora]|uniref:Unnamed protein product n=1 Tax=Ambrosiozyma monospora TaxID=43982 RepID=A0A9W6YPV8_AMBMO|nr:unnamed protein product [Ambrosiozyma monospora]
MPSVYTSAFAFSCDSAANQYYFENHVEDSYFGELGPYLIQLLEEALSPKYPTANHFLAPKMLTTVESLESVIELLECYPLENIPTIVANAATLCHSINDLVDNQHEELIDFSERQLKLSSQLSYRTNYQTLYEAEMNPITRLVYASTEKELEFTMSEDEHSLGSMLDQQLKLIESLFFCLSNAVTSHLRPSDSKLFTNLVREIIKLCSLHYAEARNFTILSEKDAALELEMIIQETHLEISYRVTQAGINAIVKLARALDFDVLDSLFLPLFGLDFEKLFSKNGTLFMNSKKLKSPSFDTWIKLHILQEMLKAESDSLLCNTEPGVSESLLNKIELLLDQVLEFDQTTGCDEKLVDFMRVWEPIRIAIVKYCC